MWLKEEEEEEEKEEEEAEQRATCVVRCGEMVFADLKTSENGLWLMLSQNVPQNGYKCLGNNKQCAVAVPIAVCFCRRKCTIFQELKLITHIL